MEAQTLDYLRSFHNTFMIMIL